MSRTAMDRFWVNQPSTTQRDHRHHGTRVLVARQDYENDSEFVNVNFLEGDVHSAHTASHQRTQSIRSILHNNKGAIRQG